MNSDVRNFDFHAYCDLRKNSDLGQELALNLSEAAEAGVDVGPYITIINNLEEVIAEGIGSWLGSKIGGGLGSVADFGANAVGRGLDAGISGLGSGILQGAKRAGRVAWNGGAAANGPAFDIKDAVNLVNSAIQKAQKSGAGGQAVATALKQINTQLQQQLSALSAQSGMGNKRISADQDARARDFLGGLSGQGQEEPNPIQYVGG